jgi:hypothetical protein
MYSGSVHVPADAIFFGAILSFFRAAFECAYCLQSLQQNKSVGFDTATLLLILEIHISIFSGSGMYSTRLKFHSCTANSRNWVP